MFDQKEIDNASVKMRGYGPSLSFATPITPRENFKRLLKKEALWMPSAGEKMWFCPRIIPDNIARAFVIEGEQYTGEVGGKDMFGVDWEYVPSARGSIVRPGNPTLTDISKWEETIQFPDPDTWDWEGSLEMNRGFLTNSEVYVNFCVFTGWFERLIAFMDFGPAAYALMNKKQKPFVHAFFDMVSDLWIKIVDKVHDTYGDLVDGFAFHDDWGSQGCPFFNKRIVDEMLVPYMKRVTDHCHSLGYTTELHSCGKIDQLIPCIIDAGWDFWDGMGINDYHKDYEEYGDKLIMSVACNENAPDDDIDAQLALAGRFADEYARKDKPALISFYSYKSEAFSKELYKASRMKFDA